MSNIYVTEPPTRGKVVLHTSFGDVDIDLWSKEAPLACRNFVQLALEGYYDNTIFHRLIKGFMIQGGDPTGTGQGGESIYGKPFKDETHQRIKFNHRGQVAMANENRPNSNSSQFFITLDKCEWLNKKHTIFGKISGPTIFNVLRVEQLETDSNDRPFEPPSIKSITVLSNPFDDIVPRKEALQRLQEQEAKKEEEEGTKKKTKKPKRKQVALLSFGDEEEEHDEEIQQIKSSDSGAGPVKGIMSSHEVLEDPTLASEAVEATAPAASSKHSERSGSEPDEEDEKAGGGEKDFATAMREKMMAKRRRLEGKHGEDASNPEPKMSAKEKEIEDKRKKAAEAAEEYRQLKREMKDKYRTKRAVPVATGKELAKETEAFATQDLLSPLQQRRARFLARKRKHGAREKDTLARLAAFQSTLKTTVTADDGKDEGGDEVEKEAYSGQVLEGRDDNVDVNNPSWMNTKLKFKKHIDDVFRSDDYVTIDAAKEDEDPMSVTKDIRRKEKPRDSRGRHSHHRDSRDRHSHRDSRDRHSHRDSRDRRR